MNHDCSPVLPDVMDPQVADILNEATANVGEDMRGTARLAAMLAMHAQDVIGELADPKTSPMRLAFIKRRIHEAWEAFQGARGGTLRLFVLAHYIEHWARLECDSVIAVFDQYRVTYDDKRTLAAETRIVVAAEQVSKEFQTECPDAPPLNAVRLQAAIKAWGQGRGRKKKGQAAQWPTFQALVLESFGSRVRRNFPKQYSEYKRDSNRWKKKNGG